MSDSAEIRNWRIVAQICLDPLPVDWREQLIQRLGQRPRRIGAWAELALYGARLCLDAAHEATLPADVQLRVASLSGPLTASRTIIEQAQTSLPRPFTFMQSQPSQLLATLSQHLQWQGDARFTVSRDRDAVLELAQLECSAAGLLIGWVEEDTCTQWWRMVAAGTGQKG